MTQTRQEQNQSPARRIGTVSADNRARLIAAAETLMRERGHAQVTSRKLAEQADLKPQLVHYYFRTMDDLFEELFRQSTDRQIQALEQAARAPDPLVALFELTCDPSSTTLQIEFLSLANHRPRLRELITQFGATLNQREGDLLKSELARRGIETSGFSAEQIATLFQTAAHGLAFAGSFDQARFESARNAVLDWLRSTA